MVQQISSSYRENALINPHVDGATGPLFDRSTALTTRARGAVASRSDELLARRPTPWRRTRSSRHDHFGVELFYTPGRD